jgi:hypothetical protein
MSDNESGTSPVSILAGLVFIWAGPLLAQPGAIVTRLLRFSSWFFRHALQHSEG